jgi:hypothetical protein
VNAHRLPDNWFSRVGSVVCGFYCLEVSLKGSSLERFPMLSKKKKKNWLLLGTMEVIDVAVEKLGFLFRILVVEIGDGGCLVVLIDLV